MKSVVVGEGVLTPQAAATILKEHNQQNRPMTFSQLKLLENTMLLGQWMLTGETIIFTKAETLLNGQHRLTACVNSGVEIPVLVVVGVEPVAFKYMDLTAKRKLQHVLTMMGYKCSPQLAGAANLLYDFLRGGRFVSGRTLRATHDELIELVAIHSRLADLASMAMSKGREVFPSPSLFATLYYIFESVNCTLAQDFFGAIAEIRVPDAERWQACQLLVRRLIAERGNKGLQLRRSFVAALTIKAWNAVVNNQGAKVLKWAEGEEFPRVAGLAYEDGKPLLQVTGAR